VLARRVAVINEKGGSAKTTLVSTIGSYLALHRGRRILAVDMDPQGQLGKVLGVETRARSRSAIDLLLDSVLRDASSLDNGTENAADRALRPTSTLPIVTTRIPQLDVITANKSLGLFSILEDDETDPTGRLLRALDSAPEIDNYDFVLFDAPPSFGPLTLNVLRVPANQARKRDSRSTQAALSEGNCPYRRRLSREDRRGAIPRTLHLRVRTERSLCLRDGRTRRRTRASRKTQLLIGDPP